MCLASRVALLLLCAASASRGGETRLLSGVVRNAGGSTIAGIIVQIEPGGIATKSDAEGRFSVAAPPDGVFVEVLKGSAAVPYGAGEPGGVVNFVTKKPRTEQSGEASIRAGTFRQRGGHAEVTGPLVRGRSVFYRAAWFQEDRRSFRYNSENQNVHVANALS